MQTLSAVTFPIYELGKYDNIETSLLGRTRIYLRDKEFILDDNHLEGNLGERRLKLKRWGKPLWKLKKRITLLRQLLKMPGNVTYIDNSGRIFKYKKSVTAQITSHRITQKIYDNNVIGIFVENIPSPFIIDFDYQGGAFASIANTPYGPILYDITEEKHVPYRRRI
jgi:hypothetical protein